VGTHPPPTGQFLFFCWASLSGPIPKGQVFAPWLSLLRLNGRGVMQNRPCAPDCVGVASSHWTTRADLAPGHRISILRHSGTEVNKKKKKKLYAWPEHAAQCRTYSYFVLARIAHTVEIVCGGYRCSIELSRRNSLLRYPPSVCRLSVWFLVRATGLPDDLRRPGRERCANPGHGPGEGVLRRCDAAQRSQRSQRSNWGWLTEATMRRGQETPI
jgi:hypothetical protein